MFIKSLSFSINRKFTLMINTVDEEDGERVGKEENHYFHLRVYILAYLKNRYFFSFSF